MREAVERFKSERNGATSAGVKRQNQQDAGGWEAPREPEPFPDL